MRIQQLGQRFDWNGNRANGRFDPRARLTFRCRSGLRPSRGHGRYQHGHRGAAWPSQQAGQPARPPRPSMAAGGTTCCVRGKKGGFHADCSIVQPRRFASVSGAQSKAQYASSCPAPTTAPFGVLVETARKRSVGKVSACPTARANLHDLKRPRRVRDSSTGFAHPSRCSATPGWHQTRAPGEWGTKMLDTILARTPTAWLSLERRVLGSKASPIRTLGRRGAARACSIGSSWDLRINA